MLATINPRDRSHRRPPVKHQRCYQFSQEKHPIGQGATFGPMHKWESAISQGDKEHSATSIIPLTLLHGSSSSVHIPLSTVADVLGHNNSFSTTAVPISERVSKSPPSGTVRIRQQLSSCVDAGLYLGSLLPHQPELRWVRSSLRLLSHLLWLLRSWRTGRWGGRGRRGGVEGQRGSHGHGSRLRGGLGWQTPHVRLVKPQHFKISHVTILSCTINKGRWGDRGRVSPDWGQFGLFYQEEVKFYET